MIDEARADERAFALLLEEYGQGIRRTCRFYAGTPEDRDDLFQDICLALWRALPRFRADAALRTYVFRIVHNRGISHRLQRRAAGAESADMDTLPSSQRMPDQEVERASEVEALHSAIRQLPLLQQQAVAMSLEGLDHTSIGQVLGKTSANVAVILHRARQQLRTVLGVSGEENDDNPT